jgi:hypothetical protein
MLKNWDQDWLKESVYQWCQPDQKARLSHIDIE